MISNKILLKYYKETFDNKEYIKHFQAYEPQKSLIPESAHKLVMQKDKLQTLGKALDKASELSKKREASSTIFGTTSFALLAVSLANILITDFSDFWTLEFWISIVILGISIISIIFSAIRFFKSEDKYYGPYWDSFREDLFDSGFVPNKLFELATKIVELDSPGWSEIKICDFDLDFDIRTSDIKPYITITNKIEGRLSTQFIKIPADLYNDSLPGFDFSIYDKDFEAANEFIEALKFPYIPEKTKSAREFNLRIKA